MSDAANELDRVFVSEPLKSEVSKITELVASAAEPVADSVEGSALYFLGCVFARALKLGSWSSPHITLSENNEIVFEWWHGTKKITLYFGESGAEYIKVWGTDIETEMDSGPLRDDWSLTSLWIWLNH
ncbi:hypothetical protein [Bradyrhizobium sp. SZCCHNRI1009]|uniref:hypothetical protein n=1 Tax=Bradyrhizobium sp. SZCCHNRI1009 TaxID=3057277 RepID=UPI0029170F32|nr:hypothetical protein [Bradyrhizobium sp. SZCCHNRI1009]